MNPPSFRLCPELALSARAASLDPEFPPVNRTITTKGKKAVELIR